MLARRTLRHLAVLACCVIPGTLHAEPLDCVIEPKAVIDLATSEEGRIDEVPVARGDRVKPGDLLIGLDDGLQRLQVEMAKARLDSDVDVRAAEARMTLRQKELDRVKQLHARNVAATTAVEDAEIEAALTSLALEEAQLARRLAAIEYAQAKEVLARRSITSPVDGVVVSVEAAPGEYAHDQIVLMTIADIHPLRVKVFVPADYYGRIALGEVYEVNQVAPLDGRYRARVTVVDPVFDAASGTFGVELEIANPDGAIPAGTRCRVDLDRPSSGE